METLGIVSLDAFVVIWMGTFSIYFGVLFSAEIQQGNNPLENIWLIVQTILVTMVLTLTALSVLYAEKLIDICQYVCEGEEMDSMEKGGSSESSESKTQ